MNKLKDKQRDAVYVSGKNTIVSAGAGSGKTFVLKTRVQRLVKDEKIPVERLVILTFTNNAAAEMKNRIRNVIKNTPEIANQLDLVDSAYITTFDSFAQSLVKKYNYLLDIDKHFSIIDENIVNIELGNILNDIFKNYYENPTKEFDNLITDTCDKDDTDLINEIIGIYRKLTTLKNRKKFLDDYEKKFFSSDNKLKELIKEYNQYILDKGMLLLPLYQVYLDHAKSEKARNSLEERIEAVKSVKTVQDLCDILKKRKPQNGNGYQAYDDEDFTSVKDETSDIEKEIKALGSITDTEFKEQYWYTKDNIILLIKIIKELDERIMNFKRKHNAYEFQDISLMALELVNKKEIADELRSSIDEIMIDEYQDTNDIQDEFITKISNNNVYMVGDVKQSIYRFRYANPYIFKEKYDKYTDDLKDTTAKGYRIDMKDNFRSRPEVVNNINDLFSKIMFDDVGGADYITSHKMNSAKEEYKNYRKDEFDYNMQIYNYNIEGFEPYGKAVAEAFIIAKDIKEKKESGMLIMDKDNSNFYPIKYSDFCILVDKSTNFDLLKKVLEYFKIPAIIEKDVSIKSDDEVFIIKNLITLLIHIKDDNLDEDFKHAFMSIARSYIARISDQEIFDIFADDSYKNTDIYIKLMDLAKNIDGLSNKEILIELINKFDIFSKLIEASDVNNRSAKLEYFINNAEGLNKFGLDIYSLEQYFANILTSEDDFKMESKNADANAVKIMTIHGSKGLEFPIVYMPYLGSEFKPRKQAKYPFSDRYGFILEYKKDNILDKTFVRKLRDITELKENISEKIRLLYVAVTRAREKFILINTWNDKLESKSNINSQDILNCKSYTDILSILRDDLSSYTTDIDLNTLGLTDAYNSYLPTDYDSKIKSIDDVIETDELDIAYEFVENKHFSKELKDIKTKEKQKALDLGTYLHTCLEAYDFKNDNIKELHIDSNYEEYIKAFLDWDVVKNIKNAVEIYKEYEFREVKDDSIYTGVIDLLVEYPDHFDIIDYKTSNIEGEEYDNQVKGYKEYLEKKIKYQKPIKCYLYSIKNKDYREVS